MKKFFLVFLALMIILPLFAGASSLPRTLYLGMSGEDVRTLQVFLNSNPDTNIAEVGPGSPGNETSYFGFATKNAVMKFQKKYSNDVLKPIGLTEPTGILGPLSRIKISTLDQSSLKSSARAGTPTSFPEETSNFFSRFFVRELKLYALSRYGGVWGTEVKIAGQGFLSKENTVHLGPNYQIDNLSGINGVEISFTVPSSIPIGKYNVWVSNKNGSTYEASFGDFFSVTSATQPLPIIESIAPTSIAYGDLGKTEIVLMVRNVDQRFLKVVTSLGDPQNVKYENGKISFFLNQVSNFNYLSRSEKYLKKVEVPIYIHVFNEAGQNEVPTALMVQF